MKKFLKTNRDALALFLIFLVLIFLLGCSKSETIEEFYWRQNAKCFEAYGSSQFDTRNNTFVCLKGTRVLFTEKK